MPWASGPVVWICLGPLLLLKPIADHMGFSRQMRGAGLYVRAHTAVWMNCTAVMRGPASGLESTLLIAFS